MCPLKVYGLKVHLVREISRERSSIPNTGNEQSYWSGKRICLTAGPDSWAHHVLEGLRVRGATEPLVPRSATYDLTNLNAVHRLYTNWLGSPGNGTSRSHPDPLSSPWQVVSAPTGPARQTFFTRT